VAREPEYTKRYLNDAGALAPGGSQASREVLRVLRALREATELPGPHDVSALIARADSQVQSFAHGRRVPGRDLWVWYQATSSDTIRFVALTKTESRS
jgi:hypothetical protein